MSLIAIIISSYINIFSSPLGPSSVDDILGNAETLYGYECRVAGELTILAGSEFRLGDSSVEIQLAWTGEDEIPLNGSVVIAYGRLIKSASGPALICDHIIPLSDSDILYDNPWSSSVLRMLSSISIWFLLSVSIGLILAISYLKRQSPSLRSMTRANLDICFLSGIIMIILATILMLIEPEIASGLGYPFFALTASVIISMIFILMQIAEKREISDLAFSLPIVSCIISIMTIVSIYLIGDVMAGDMIAIILKNYPFEFPYAILIGTLGYFSLGLYLAFRRSESIELSESIRASQNEVR